MKDAFTETEEWLTAISQGQTGGCRRVTSVFLLLPELALVLCFPLTPLFGEKVDRIRKSVLCLVFNLREAK
jgi:hypothetical protein